MNNCVFSGRICKDIELRQTQNGNTVMQNSIAVRRDFKNANGQYDSDFINIVVYGQTAQFLSQHACKGTLIEVVGRWQHRSYQDSQGNTKYVDECVVNSASVLQKPQEQGQQPQYQQQGNYQQNNYYQGNYQQPVQQQYQQPVQQPMPQYQQPMQQAQQQQKYDTNETFIDADGNTCCYDENGNLVVLPF